jgi:hypothetical protein
LNKASMKDASRCSALPLVETKWKCMENPIIINPMGSHASIILSSNACPVVHSHRHSCTLGLLNHVALDFIVQHHDFFFMFSSAPMISALES